MKKYILFGILSAVVIFISALLIFLGDNKSVLSVYDENFSLFKKFLPFVSRDVKENKFLEVISRTKEKRGTYGIYIVESYYERVYYYNKDELFYGASLYKVPIAVAVVKSIEEGSRSYSDKIVYLDSDSAGGTGTINKLSPGTDLTIEYVLDRLLKNSDNTAQNMLTRVLPESEINRSFTILETKNYFYNSNNVTPYQMASYFQKILQGDYISLNSAEKLLNKMSQTSFDNRINQGLSEDVKFSHKIGNWGETGTWHDCGVASKNNKKVIVCVMSRNTTYQDFLEVTKDVGEFVNILF